MHISGNTILITGGGSGIGLALLRELYYEGNNLILTGRDENILQSVKKEFPNIKYNGGGDLCLPTLNGNLVLVNDVPQTNIPIWNYDKVFGTVETISKDRARFSRAWFRQFNDWGVFGGESEKEAFDAWFSMVETRYKKHVLKLNMNDHPKYIKNKLLEIEPNQFGYDAFGLKQKIKPNINDYMKSYKNKLLQMRYI